MDHYLVFIGVAITTILLPGPGVLFTLNNSLQQSFSKTLMGIIGIILGVFVVASISATGVSILLTGSVLAFTLLKIFGALYLVYLGIKMLKTQSQFETSSAKTEITYRKIFFDGLCISLSNPKGIVFFMSIFPQFINPQADYAQQFMVLAVTFCILLVLIHSSYALFASAAKSKLASTKGKNLLNKVSGGIFICFGLGLAASR